MSFADPQSWTDVDADGVALDWTSRKNKLIYPAYEHLRRANLERLKGVNGQNSDIPFVPKGIMPAALKHDIDNHYISSFANCLETDVQFTGCEQWNNQPVIKHWTSADLLAELGVSAWISSDGKLLSEEWEIQRYGVLNLLRRGIGFQGLGYQVNVTFNDDFTTVIFSHTIPRNDDFLGYFPPHMWEVWCCEIKPGWVSPAWQYDIPHKLYSEWISTPMEAGDTHSSPELIVADIFNHVVVNPTIQSTVYNNRDYYYEFMMYDYANDLGNGFKFYDWTPKEIPT